MAATAADRTLLVEISDAHFRWMLGRQAVPPDGLRLPPGGVDTPETLRIVRAMTRRLFEAGSRGSWMMAADGEVVGLCSYKQAPKDGMVEIGYGVAASRRNRGHATRAVSAMLAFARQDAAVRHVTAGTAVANIASQRALERNGFVRTGTGHDPDDGDLVLWGLDLQPGAPLSGG
jgi:RimJ/RimL family protein N-acetyltransferase